MIEMIWYLLYPLRGTTDPPRLSPTHPIRRAFYLHGKRTAQQWLLAMLVSVAVAVGFTYPTLFLSVNPKAGIQLRPHHVWTTSTPFDGNPSQSDIEMRQIWIYGSYMHALDKVTLQGALRVQAEVLGEEGTAMLPEDRFLEREQTWGYHSPLLYWNNSAEKLNQDEDIFKTIQDHSREYSSLKIGLRPASVFAGKQFDGWKLKAADAIVISMLNRVGDGAGTRWSERMMLLKDSACANCTMFPTNGHVSLGFAFVLGFTPLSLRENMALAVAYSGMVIYVVVALSRLKAFHSRFGLCVTAIVQMMCSILASITICGILKINLSTIPQNTYPFVVLVIGLENMFRIINAIVAQNPARPTEIRIANALGDVGPGSVATAAQNFLILLFLSRFVSSGVAAFCAFACIAILFDVFFLLTFFVAVLSVDIRRLELQDALIRANHNKKTKRRPPPAHRGSSWLSAMMSGNLPFSTRMAGTAMMTTFILFLNYHFFERHEHGTSSLRQLLAAFFVGSSPADEPRPFTPSPVNATVTPDEWFRMQDFGTAWEVMSMAKPGAINLAVRVFSPLTIVLPGSDRSDSPAGSRDWSVALRSFTLVHFYPTAIAVIFIVGFVLLLMNFLLYSDATAGVGDDDGRKEDYLTAQTVTLPHKLDIVKVCGHEKGHFITIALDRSVSISVFDTTSKSYQVHSIQSESLALVTWPIHTAVIDDGAEWAALLTSNDRVLIYNITKGSVVHGLEYPDDHPPVIFQFTRLMVKDEARIYFIMATSGGRLRMCGLEKGQLHSESLSRTTLLGGAVVELPGHCRKLVTVTDDAQIVSRIWADGKWHATTSGTLPINLPGERATSAVTIETHPYMETDFLIVSTHSIVLIVDEMQLSVIGRLSLEAGQHLRGSVLIGPKSSCQFCGSLAFRSIAMSYETASNRDCYLLCLNDGRNGQDNDNEVDDHDGGICLRNTKTECTSFSTACRAEYSLDDAGTWHPLRSQSVLGLRKQPQTRPTNQSKSKSTLTPSLQRRRIRGEAQFDENPATIWEAYEFSVDGEVETIELATEKEADDSTAALYVNTAGPTVSLDSQSVAVAFGNTVKVIRSTRRGVAVRHDSRPPLKRQQSTSRRRVTSFRT